jgi:AcrR family transcriptional regulator
MPMLERDDGQNETIEMMQKQSSSETRPSVLDPTTPRDIGVLSQRRRIIDAMVSSCAEKSYPATTISDIVSRASISRTTFYKRFSGKRDCFDAAVEACIDEIRGVAGETSSGWDSPPEAVRKTTGALLELMASKPALAQVLTGDAIWFDPSITDRYRQLVMPALEGLLDVGGEGKAKHSSPGLAFGRAQLLIFNEIAAGRSEQLHSLHPEIVYLSLAPFIGHQEAIKQSRLAEQCLQSKSTSSSD